MQRFVEAAPILAGACVLAAFVAVIPGQFPEKTPPVELHEDAVESTSDGAKARLRLVNRSAKNVRGYVILSEFLDSDGKVYMDATQIRLHPPHRPHRIHSFNAGESWTEEFKLPLANGRVVNHTVALDYVLFEDGTSWGPDSRHLSFKIMGILEGFRVERLRLQQLYQQGGAQAVLEDLR